MKRALLRYAVIGGIATATHYALLVAAVELGHWPAWLASGAGAVVGAQIGYAGNRWFTFGHHGAVLRSWPRFQATAALGALLGMAVVGALVALGLHYLLAQATATLAMMLLTFEVNRRWSFAPTAGRAGSGRAPDRS